MLFVPLTDSISTWITAFDADSGVERWHIKRPGQTNLEPLLGGNLRIDVGNMMPGPEDPRRMEVLVAATGASVWSVMHTGVCEAEGWLVAATPDGSLAIWDSERAAARPLISEVVWPSEGGLAYCHRRGTRLWLVVERVAIGEPSTWTILEPGENGPRPGVRVSSAKFGSGGVLGKWLPQLGEPPSHGAALLDIETGRFAWSQDPSVDPIAYRGDWHESDAVLLLDGQYDGARYFMSIDRSSGAALGGVKISGAWMKGRAHGMLWFIGEEQTLDAPLGLAVLDERTLRPVATPGPGITVTDRGEVVRAAWRTAALTQAPPEASRNSR
jgi:hypothetical protein